ncbi:MAG: IspD/TarI family cytidylyltransferase [Leptospirales bacterium]
MPAIHIVVLSGGVGARMGAGQPKQFLLLAGRPVLAHSVAAFIDFKSVAAIHLVAPPNYIEETGRILEGEGVRDRIQVVPGGSDRHASTLAGLAAVLARQPADEDLVLIHDAARPLVQGAEIEALIQVFSQDPGRELASLAAPISETIVEADALPGPLARSVDRTRFFAVKTPQAARVACLRRMIAEDEAGANQSTDSPGPYTDLLTWGEAHGIQGALVPADPRNLKLTHPGDLPYLSSLLDS